MITDPIPRVANLRRQFEESDAKPHLALPPAEPLQKLASSLADALATEERPKVKKAGLDLLTFLATTYQVTPPKLSVLGARPKKVSEGSSYELWGDYTFATQAIRVWMRTAVLGKVTSFRGLLNTLLHEFCHHLDVKHFGWPDTPHTRGFYGRIDDLYHLALATPADQRRPLVWIKGRNTWRIDWAKLRAKPAAPSKALPRSITQAP
ncbi:MAG TPA: hypothetical protein VIM14_11945 [Polyangia bacterium]